MPINAASVVKCVGRGKGCRASGTITKTENETEIKTKKINIDKSIMSCSNKARITVRKTEQKKYFCKVSAQKTQATNLARTNMLHATSVRRMQVEHSTLTQL